jgi:hypothetical protein
MRFPLAALVPLALVAVAFAADAPKPHPHFNDQGVLSWSVKLADAQAAAKSGDKLIFIEYGREA